jgi:hypothetical protein
MKIGTYVKHSKGSADEIENVTYNAKTYDPNQLTREEYDA